MASKESILSANWILDAKTPEQESLLKRINTAMDEYAQAFATWALENFEYDELYVTPFSEKHAPFRHLKTISELFFIWNNDKIKD